MTARGLLVLALAAGRAAAAPAGEPTVAVHVLTQHHPRRVTLRGEQVLTVASEGPSLRIDGRERPGPLELPHGRWIVVVDGGPAAAYDAALTISVASGELALVARMGLEDYVARAVAAETAAGTPPAALAAQAIVARSFALAGPARHADADLCDLAHCQAMRWTPAGKEARAAAESTRGQVLALPDGRTASAVFHAGCGGSTSDPAAVFGGTEDATGAGAVRDDGCADDSWRADLPLEQVRQALAPLLGSGVPWSRLEIERDAAGRVVRVVDRATSRWAAGDAVVRALDRSADWGVVRSALFQARERLGGLALRGTGHGHGVGLCQRGAARMARRGASAGEILARYFPRAACVKK